jgi:hypothetical protein
MSNFESEGFQNNEWEDRGELAWSEFDWERYLKSQDDTLVRYLAAYDPIADAQGRIDEVARQLGWDPNDTWDSGEEEPDDEEDSKIEAPQSREDFDPYTVHRNPVFIATRALFTSISFFAERVAEDPAKFPPRLAVAFLRHLHNAEISAVLAIQGLDLGDYALGISLLKRALASLNHAIGELPATESERNKHFAKFRDYAMPRLFDLREIWLRVMNECRDELGRPVEDEGEEES